jgi:acyl-CoA thioesterase FadM
MTISHPAFRDRDEFRYLVQVQTRWSDNDCFGHVNNVVYYSYFDTVVNGYLIQAGGFRPQAAEVIGVVVETMCQYRTSISFPEKIDADYRWLVLDVPRSDTRSHCSPREGAALARPDISFMSMSIRRRGVRWKYQQLSAKQPSR